MNDRSGWGAGRLQLPRDGEIFLSPGIPHSPPVPGFVRIIREFDGNRASLSHQRSNP
jgi:hypothetical protein